MPIPNPINILQSGKSYIGNAMSYVRHPSKLLTGTSLGFLANTTLSKAEGRGDPLFNIFWTIQLPAIPVADEVNSSLLSSASSGLSTLSENISGWSLANRVLGSDTVGNITEALDTAQKQINDANTALANSSKSISLSDEYVESISLVNKEYSTRTVFRAGQEWKYPEATVSIPDITMVLYGDRNLKSFRYIQNWMNLIQGPVSQTVLHGGWTVPSMYKKTITIGVADENDNQFYLVDYLKCWPTSIQQIELNSDSDDYIKYEVTLSVDDLKVYGYDLMSFTDQLINYGKSAIPEGATKLYDQVQGWAQSGTNKILTGII